MTIAQDHWLSALLLAVQREDMVVRILLAEVQGSAPREPGAVMLVGRGGAVGTIGGGQLEWQALGIARTLLQDPMMPAGLHRLVLGTDLGQCCGGVVQVWIERYTRDDLPLLEAANRAAQHQPAVLETIITPSTVVRQLVSRIDRDVHTNQLLQAPRPEAVPAMKRMTGGSILLLERLDTALPPLWLFGAGHVGRALAKILADLPIAVTWIDSRAELCSAHGVEGSVPVIHAPEPVESVARAPSGTCFVVMTHSHPLDYALCRTILARGDFSWLGLIGSLSKAARFRSRLTRQGVSAADIVRLVCPIGIPGIKSKLPAAIAVAIAAQVLQGLTTQDERAEDVVLAQPAAAPSACAEAQCGGCRQPAVPTVTIQRQ